MAEIEIKEVLKITANPGIIGDVDKLSLTFVFKEEEYRMSIPFEEITSKAKLKELIKKAILSRKPRRQVINLTEKWKGVYQIYGVF